MLRTIFVCCALALLGACTLQTAHLTSLGPAHSHLSLQSTPPQTATQPTSSVPLSAPEYRALLDSYCVTCHNQTLRTAGLLLDQVDVAKVVENKELWTKVVQKLRAGAMPPAGMPRPDQAAYDSFATYLETQLGGAVSAPAESKAPSPATHRLNRAEYSNAIRDLLGVQFDGESYLPADDASKGFDNLASVLSISPVLMERYMLAAAKISRLAIGDAASPPVSDVYQVDQSLIQDNRISDDLPLGSRGGIAIHHDFPVDGEYALKIRLQREPVSENIRGLLGEPHQLEVYLDGTRLKTFSVGGERFGPVGLLNARTGDVFMSEGAQLRYEQLGAEEGLQLRIPVRAGTRLLGVTFRKKNLEAEGLLEIGPRPMIADLRQLKGGDPNIGSVTISGPYATKGVGDTPSRRRIFVCRPAGSTEAGNTLQSISLRGNEGRSDEASCARTILLKLAHHAYRRPVTDPEIQDLLALYKKGQSDRGFEAGIELALQRILAGPEFLFRIEQRPANATPGKAYQISELELASRLSFFLWSSIPDEPLLGLAESGRLNEPAVLETQVRRMLADPRSNALAENFAGQWLYLRNLTSWYPSDRDFPEFDGELRYAMKQETELFFKSIVGDDRSVLDLLNADYTFLNERLALHYRIPDIYGSNFRKVKLTDENRRGLLGQGSILTVTGRPNRTSPVLRGKWVLENLLGTPPPPPPPNVPALKEDRAQTESLTMRERMMEHRINPACISCHAQMDPIGFALENFDAVGKWRTKEGSSPIDASAVLVDGTQFEGPAGLRKVLLRHPGQFVQTVTEKLLIYALGRELDPDDKPAVEAIVKQGAPAYSWSSLILGIVKSSSFQMRRSLP